MSHDLSVRPTTPHGGSQKQQGFSQEGDKARSAGLATDVAREFELGRGLRLLHRHLGTWRKVTEVVFENQVSAGYVFQIAAGSREPNALAQDLWAKYRQKNGSDGKKGLPERLMVVLGTGIANAMTQHDLGAILLADPREIRDAIRTLRREGEDIATGNPGCWKAKNEPERLQYVLGQLTSRARDENATVRLYLENRPRKKGLTIREMGVLKTITELELGLQELLEEE